MYATKNSSDTLRRLTRVRMSKERGMPEVCRSGVVRVTAAEPLPGSQKDLPLSRGHTH